MLLLIFSLVFIAHMAHEWIAFLRIVLTELRSDVAGELHHSRRWLVHNLELTLLGRYKQKVV